MYIGRLARSQLEVHILILAKLCLESPALGHEQCLMRLDMDMGSGCRCSEIQTSTYAREANRLAHARTAYTSGTGPRKFQGEQQLPANESGSLTMKTCVMLREDLPVIE